MRTMYDSIEPAAIPTDAEMVGGYIDGSWGPNWSANGKDYGWDDAAWARFPNAIKVRIAATAQTDDGHVLDVEAGDALSSEAPGWTARRRAAGVEPSIYCNLSNVGAVLAAFDAAGVILPALWLAHYDGVATLPDGYVAKQYADQDMIPGRPHYDLSVVADIWPGVDEVDAVTKDEFEQWKANFQQVFVAPTIDSLKAHADAINHLLADDAVHGNAELAAQITKVGVALDEAALKLEQSAANIPQ